MKPKVPKHNRKPQAWKAPSYCDMIRQLPCLLTGRPAECVHIRYADAAHGKEVTGMQRRDDRWVLPLCPELHRLLKGCQHDSAEREWWAQFGIDPVEVAKQLWGKTRIQMENVITMRTPWDQKTRDKITAILKGAK